MLLRLLLPSLLFAVTLAANAGDVIPNQYIVLFPSQGNRFSPAGEINAEQSEVRTQYTQRFQGTGMSVLGALRVPKNDAVLLQSNNRSSVNALAVNGVQVFENKVVKINDAQRSATWNLGVRVLFTFL